MIRFESDQYGWRSRPVTIEFDEPTEPDAAPVLWKDLTVATVLSLMLWTMVALIFLT